MLPTGRNFCRKTQKWPQKNPSGRENPRPNCRYAGFPKNGSKGAELLEMSFSHKILDNLQHLSLKSHDLSDFFPSTKKPIKSAFYRKDGEWPNFVFSGRIFRLIWKKTFARSWQH
jgi:hypothetical protein